MGASSRLLPTATATALLLLLLCLSTAAAADARGGRTSASTGDGEAPTTGANGADHLAFYETHLSPMGWSSRLRRAAAAAAAAADDADAGAGPSAPLSNDALTARALRSDWKAQLDPSTLRPRDRAAEKAYVMPKVHITVKRPGRSSSWNTSTSKAARAYNNLRLRYRNTVYNSVRPGPARFYMPSTVKQLVQTIKRLNRAGTRWVVRGGGHSYEATALPAGTDAAVIDMARFSEFRIAADGKSAVIGGGQRLGDVYLRLAQHDPPLLMVAGTCAANGASGYLLGGGVGVSSRKYGWGAEQVMFARVVLADGTLAVASADPAAALPGQPVPAPDLLWALRGGGAGTAVVYEWTVAVYPAPATVTVCDHDFDVPTLSDYQAFATQLFSTWNPAVNLDGATYPYARFFLSRDRTDNRRVASLSLTAWDLDAQAVNATMTTGMAPLASSFAYCRTFPSWLEYARYFAIEDYYGPAAAQAATPANFTLRYQLSVDYLGWPNGQPVPLTPYAKFDAANPSPADFGPSAFRSQGVFSFGPWSSAASAAVYNLLDVGVLSAGYVLGGALAGPAGPAAADGVGSAAGAAWHQATSLSVVAVSASNAAAVAAADAAAGVLDADPAPAGVGRRFYGFLNCYGLQTPAGDAALFALYYGNTATRLLEAKREAQAEGRMSTWCGW